MHCFMFNNYCVVVCDLKMGEWCNSVIIISGYLLYITSNS